MRRCTTYQKAYILQKLRANLGDILRTYFQTGVPARTLRDWRQELLYSEAG